MQIVFQSPRQSLDEAMCVGALVAEGLRIHSVCPRRERGRRAAAALEEVGLPAAMAGRYPAELSGGQLQRVAIARALVLEPALLVLDEPVSALDVSVQARVLNLLRDLRERHGLSWLMIGHDLATVRFLSDEIAVMRGGRIVERAPAETLFRTPLHPYTRLLLSCVPAPEPARRSAAPAVPGDEARDAGPDGPLTEVHPGHWVATPEAGEITQ
jgi:peptide/nickel transport system ATP-binding protein